MLSQLTSCKIKLTGDCTNKGYIKNHVILANITIITTCNTDYSSVFLFFFYGKQMVQSILPNFYLFYKWY